MRYCLIASLRDDTCLEVNATFWPFYILSVFVYLLLHLYYDCNCGTNLWILVFTHEGFRSLMALSCMGGSCAETVVCGVPGS